MEYWKYTFLIEIKLNQISVFNNPQGVDMPLSKLTKSNLIKSSTNICACVFVTSSDTFGC